MPRGKAASSSLLALRYEKVSSSEESNAGLFALHISQAQGKYAKYKDWFLWKDTDSKKGAFKFVASKDYPLEGGKLKEGQTEVTDLWAAAHYWNFFTDNETVYKERERQWDKYDPDA